METYSMCGDLYHQGYAQAPPPGTTPFQVPPPAQSPASVSTPLAPPGIVSSPSPAPAAYGMYPPHADRWNAYPMPAAEPHPYLPYPPSALAYGSYRHYPCYQETLPCMHHHLGPPQAYMRPPPRGSDVTRFRKKRHLLQDQNLWLTSAFHADSTAFSLNQMANNAHSFHPFWNHRVDEAPVNPLGKKRKMQEIGDGRPVRIDVGREEDKSPHRSWHKAKRKKRRRSTTEGNDSDSNADVRWTISGEKVEDRKCEGPTLTEEQARENATWLELHRDARKRVQEFLHSSPESEVSLKTVKESREGAIQIAAGGDPNAMIQGTKEAIQDEVGRNTGACVVENVDAAIPVVDLLTSTSDHIRAISANNIHAPHHHDETGEPPSAKLLVKQEKSADLLQLPLHTDAALADDAHSLHSDALLSDVVSRNQYNNVEDLKSAREDALQLAAELLPDLDFRRTGEPALFDEVIDEFREQKPLIESVDNAQNVERKYQMSSTEDEGKVREHRPLIESVDNAQNVERKYQVSSTEDKLKDREEKSFEFFTKLLEENFALRKLYVENCHDGAFECLMCPSKMKKFTSLVSLVSHATNVLKTTKLPEHRGYGRAVCCLFGWDPCKIPGVPIRSAVSKSIAHMESPIKEAAAVAGNGSVIAKVGDAVEQASSNAMDSIPVADVGSAPASLAIRCTSLDDTVQEKQGSEVDKNSLEVGVGDCAPVNTSDMQVLLIDDGACSSPQHMDNNGCVDKADKESNMEGQENAVPRGERRELVPSDDANAAP